VIRWSFTEVADGGKNLFGAPPLPAALTAEEYRGIS
jgi:hypothetical protein